MASDEMSMQHNIGLSDGKDSSSQPALNSSEIQRVMAEARRQIEERKRLASLQQQMFIKQEPLDVPAESVYSDIKPQVSSIPGSESSKSARDRIAELTARIQAKLSSSIKIEDVAVSRTTIPASKPTPLLLDSEGRTVDDTGREIKMVHRMPTLKANLRSQKKEPIKIVKKEKPVIEEVAPKFLDPRVESKGTLRARRQFTFHEKGEFEALAKRLRAKAQLEKLQKEIAEKAKKTGISEAARLAVLSSIRPKTETVQEEVPDIEWWDSFLLKDGSYEEYINNPADVQDKVEGVTHLIEHPMEMKPPSEPSKPIMLPVFLTKKEKKKLRRQNRREAWKETQEKIRLGLEAAPDPKVKMSNMMRVLGTQAVQDPTKIEAVVREQMAKRQKTHEEANASRKLTVDQKKQKKIDRKSVV